MIIQKLLVNIFDSTCDKICVGNGRFFYFNDDCKLDIYYTLKRIHPVINNNSSVLFIECTEMNRKTSNVNDFCISIFLNKMGWYLGFIGKLCNDECLIYIFTGKVEKGTPIMFNKTLYHSWHKEWRNHFSPILIHTTHKNVHKKQINGKITRNSLIYPETINPCYLCHQCSKHGPDCLFVKLRIKDFNDEPNFPERIKLASSWIQMNKLFK